MSYLTKIADLLHGPGSTMPGIEMSWEQARERVEARNHPVGVPYCIVRKWVWIDLILSASELEQFHEAGLQPVLMYSPRVLYDSARRFDVGDWLRTTPLVSFSEDCFFRTRNTLYVLVGDGVRKSADPATLMSLR